MENRRFTRNALVAVLQVVVSGGAFVVLYAYMARILGVEAVGVWGIVLASTSTTVLANLGMTGGSVKFVAQYVAREDFAHVASLVQTAIMATAGAMLVMAALAYPFLDILIPFTLEEDASPAQLAEALALIPIALLSFWMSSTAGVVMACLDGFQRIDLTGYLVMAATVLYVGLALWWMPVHGLLGVAAAQVMQGGVTLVGGWILLRRVFPQLPWLPTRWSTAAFTEMIRYNVQFQVISLSLILFEPVTKNLMGRFGSLAAAGYYEYASRLVVQLRSLVNTAHRAIVPALADANERDPSQLRAVYQSSFKVISFLVTWGVPGLVGMTPLVADLWLPDGYTPVFMAFAAVLFMAWFLNLLSNPAYYANMGTGELKWNVIAHLVIGGLNLALGIALGIVYGAAGVVAGFALALVLGSSVTVISYHRIYDIPWRVLKLEKQLILLVASVAGCIAMLGSYAAMRAALPWFAHLVLLPVVYLALTLPVVWHHTVGRQLYGAVVQLMGRAS